jgi:TonB family protein
MKIYLSLLFIFFSLIGSSQNDSIFYYSKLNKAINSKIGAFYYDSLSKEKNGVYLLSSFSLVDNNWSVPVCTIFHRESITSYTYFDKNFKKDLYLRLVTKNDSGYFIKDYFNSKLIEEGFSKTIFPLIKAGIWKIYNIYSGNILMENVFKDNQLVTNKYWLPNGGFITDVFTYADKNPEYEGGKMAYLKFIAENAVYPYEAKEKGISGKIIVNVVLMKDGTITGIDLFKNVNLQLDLEALRVVNMIPKNKWTPAEMNNEKVNSLIMIPVIFTLK